MSIYWDSFATTNSYSGIGVYANELRNSLSQLDISPKMIDTSWGASNKVFQFAKLNCFRNFKDPSIVHGLANFNACILPSNCRSVVTIHDIIPLIAPKDVSTASFLQLKFLLKLILPRVDKIIAVSEWSKDSLLEYFPNYQLSEKIHVIPNGFNRINISRKPDFEIPSILLVSRFENYKGFDRLQSIIESSRSLNLKFNIVTDPVGASFLNKSEFENITIHTEISNQKLESLYEQSSLLLSLSKYEGFCLPAMEALTRGKPVLFLKGSAIDETIGKDGVGLESSNSTADWIDKILELTTEEYYNKFISNLSNNISSRSSWLDNAKKVQSIYKELGG